MIGLSTSWRSTAAVGGVDLVRELTSLGVDGLELDYRIPPALLDDMAPALKTTRVFSVHNYFPVPDILLPSQGSGDAFCLSSVDEEERKNAVDFTVKSLKKASELGVRFLVVHLGEVDCRTGGRNLVALWKEGRRTAAFEDARRELMSERRRKADAFLEALCSSLDTVLGEAEKNGTCVCMENRYYPHQIPSFDEVEWLLGRFDGAPLRYWHDIGHAVVQEQMGFAQHLDWLRRYGPFLAGVHFHDVDGVRDHLAPGQGKVAFEDIRPFLREDVLRIIEVHPFVKREELSRGIGYLRACIGG